MSKQMLLGPENQFVLTIRVDFYAISVELIRKYNTMTILNIVDCVPRVHHV